MDIETRIRELEASFDDFRQVASRLESLARTPAQRHALRALKCAPDAATAHDLMAAVRAAFLTGDDGWVGGSE
jgi:hypothetical protein